MNEEPDQQARSAFAWLGGETKVRELVDRFYDLMELEPAYQALRGVGTERTLCQRHADRHADG